MIAKKRFGQTILAAFLVLFFGIDSMAQSSGLKQEVRRIIEMKEKNGYYAGADYGIKSSIDTVHLCMVYSAPEFTVNHECTPVTALPCRIAPEEYKFVTFAFNNGGLKRVPDTFGALTPRLPMILGYYTSEQLINDQGECTCKPGIWVTDKLAERSWLLIVKSPEGYLSLNREEAQYFFDPIASKEEAVSYLCLMENVYPIYDFSFLSRPYDESSGLTYRVLKPVLNQTTVSEELDGYLVNMFDDSMPGYCLEISYKVRCDGMIRVVDADKLYTIPEDAVID